MTYNPSLGEAGPFPFSILTVPPDILKWKGSVTEVLLYVIPPFTFKVPDETSRKGIPVVSWSLLNPFPPFDFAIDNVPPLTNIVPCK